MGLTVTSWSHSPYNITNNQKNGNYLQMRYTVKVYDEKLDYIKNVLSTNDHYEAISMERELRKIYGDDNVWIADTITEILVG